MLKILNTIVLCLAVFAVQAQGIEFETTPWKEVVEKAQKENKLIYMDIYAEWCGPCKMMARNIFPVKEVGDKYNQQFVNYKVDGEKGEGISLARKYQVTAYPTNLYIDPKNESVVLKVVGATDVNGFLNRADQALAEHNDTMTLEVYQQKFKKGEKSKVFLEEYVKKAKRSDAYADEALDVYLKRYGKKPNEDLFKFLLDNTTTFDNNIVGFLSKNKARVNELYKQNGEDYFLEWLQQIPYGTFQKALKNKDERLIDVLYDNLVKYDFPSNIQGKYAFQIMYFQQSGDDERAVRLTTEMCDYLTALPEKKYEYQNHLELEYIKKAIAEQVKKAGMPESKQGEIIENTLKEHPEYALSANFLAAQKLNENARGIYEDAAASAAAVEKALKWSEKAMALSETLPQWPVFADTHAHLLYREGKKEMAVAIQEKAVKVAEEKNPDSLRELRQKLEKMKTATL